MDSAGLISNSRPRVLLLSFPTSLGLALLDNLVSNYCDVKVYSEQDTSWKDKTFYLKENKYFSITSSLPATEFSYFIIDFKSLISLNNWREILETIYKKALSKNAKLLLVAPAILEDDSDRSSLKFIKEFFRSYDLFSLIFIGETFGPRMERQESLVSKVFYEATLSSALVDYKEDFYIYPTFSPFLAKKIVKEMFSFTNSEGEILFISSQIKYSEFISLLRQYFPEANLYSSTENLTREMAHFKKRFLVEVNLKRVIEEAVEWFREHPPRREEIKKVKKTEKPLKVEKKFLVEPITVKPVEVVTKSKRNPFLGATFLTIVAFLVIPYFLILLSFLTLYISVKRVEVGDFGKAKFFLSLSSGFSSLAQKENLVLASIPLVGKVFLPQQNITGLLLSMTNTASGGVRILEDTSIVLSNVLKEGDYDLKTISNSLGVRLDTLYKDLSFLEGDFGNAGFFKPWISKFLKDTDLAETRHNILLSKNIFYELPILLGSEQKTTYLILFQNNMELRPTGGFIGSFGLVTFEKGSLSSFEVRDVYEADGSLKGHVEPPEPIKKYLGEAGWYLRDSNWDSDFPTSATKAEWFLGKELNKQVDGVIAIDLNVVSELLAAIGPIYLADYNKEINSQNLYKEVQAEAEENFFPGSQQKRNILTALSRVLIQKLTELKPESHMDLAKVLYKSLREKHILVFLHNAKAFNSFSDLGFDGGVELSVCEEKNCYADTLGIVEANVGVNKANYFLERSMATHIEIDKESIRRTLILNYQNTDTSTALNRGYKAYVRVLMPLNAQVENIVINGNLVENYDLVETQGRKEVGFLVEVPILSRSQVSVTWKSPTSLNFEESGVYKLKFRKQPGTVADSLSITIKSAVPISFDESKGAVFLTKAGQYVYNMLLAEDLNASGAWK